MVDDMFSLGNTECNTNPVEMLLYNNPLSKTADHYAC